MTMTSRQQGAVRGQTSSGRVVGWWLSLVLLAAPVWGQQTLVDVVGPNGEAVGGYRWLLEEDATFHVVPGEINPASLALQFHRSYMPVAAKGHAVGQASVSLDPAKHYFLSVLPDSGYGIGGTAIAPGVNSVEIRVSPEPLPTAQISVFAFTDTQPINNAADLPEERGLEGCSVRLFDAGGRYGMAGGQVNQDVFGNPLGTTYLADGSVDVLGTGEILTDVNGFALVKNVYPAKYGVHVVPPEGSDWVQTTTIEGTKTIDAWVKPGEAAYFMEFGPPGYHVFAGFVKPMVDTTVLSGGSTITGRITNLHLARPPDYSFNTGEPVTHTVPYIGLNDLAVGLGKGVYVQLSNPDGTFSIPDVPPGLYQLVVWDKNLDFVIAKANVTVPAGGAEVALGEVGVFQWFSRLQNEVFFDGDEDGFRDADEIGIPVVPVNLRFRDGSLYQSLSTDLTGSAPFDELFPFFNWLVAEVDFGTLKATGATITVDAGGPVNPADPWSFGGVLNPQRQPDNSNLPYRTETGTVLTQAFQGFLGQTSVIQWGKSVYGPGQNGGISGMVHYAVTRAEDDPRFAVAEVWEPGIPRVQVNLYEDRNADGRIDDLDGDGMPTLADVDNHPFGNFPGLEDVDRDGDFVFDYGDAVQITTTDSWDDNLPSGCPGDPTDPFYMGGKGYDGIRNWNQVRPGVFDGAYAFRSHFPGGMANGAPEVNRIPFGTYIVEAVPPRSALGTTYEIVKEEDRNVDFGDTWVPGTDFGAPPLLVGDFRVVPPELSLFPGIPAPFAGEVRRLGDRKQISIGQAQNAVVNFFMFTEVPIASHVVGMVLNDLANEFDVNSPQFGEKYAPPWVPVTFRDWAGNVISRFYCDQWGTFNALVPSTFSKNLPSPSGMAPNMLTATMNDAGPIPDPAHPGQFITDPFYNPQYSQFRYTFQYAPGTTTYLDTPVLPIAAFAGPDQFSLDCELLDGTPKIRAVSGAEGGPYVATAGASITILSEGRVNVPNPTYDGPGGVNPKSIARDYGFGTTPGQVTIGGVPLTGVVWTDATITGTVAPGTATGQLEIVRGDNGTASQVGLTVTVGPFDGGVRHVVPDATPGATPIQDAIDAAAPGDLILVGPGSYEELVILWKPVHLQGWGSASTFINAIQAPSDKLLAWRAKVLDLIATGAVDLLPGQQAGAGGGGIQAPVFATEEGPGILVMGKDVPPRKGGFGLVRGRPNASIDGLTVMGASLGGGIFINGYARHLAISNNRIAGNHGFYGGGIRSGHPLLTGPVGPGGAPGYVSCRNENLKIHHNHITQNGGMGGAGGGLSLHTGSDLYTVTDNLICGNFSMGDGGGIGHLGLSKGGLIAHNRIYFNQTFNQGRAVSGGGLFIGGGGPVGGPGALTPGSGSVRIVSNLILGNLSGAGDGGGISMARVNGSDLSVMARAGLRADSQPGAGGQLMPGGGTTAPAVGPGGADGTGGANVRGHQIGIFNNLIVNNVAGLAGGGISLQDAVRVSIAHNTITNNDSTATSGEAFAPGSPSQSTPQPAGVVSRVHSRTLADAITALGPTGLNGAFSDPLLVNNVVRHNRSFYFLVDDTQVPPVYSLVPDIAAGDPPVFRDLEVLGTQVPSALVPRHCILTDVTGYSAGNLAVDPVFAAEYFNGDRGQTVLMPEAATNIMAAPAFDEGGNFIDVRFGPLTLTDPQTGVLLGDYHIQQLSPAIDAGLDGMALLFADLSLDIDGEPRPSPGTAVDIGADEVPSTAPLAGPGEPSTRYRSRTARAVTGGAR